MMVRWSAARQTLVRVLPGSRYAFLVGCRSQLGKSLGRLCLCDLCAFRILQRGTNRSTYLGLVTLKVLLNMDQMSWHVVNTFAKRLGVHPHWNPRVHHVLMASYPPWDPTTGIKGLGLRCLYLHLCSAVLHLDIGGALRRPVLCARLGDTGAFENSWNDQFKWRFQSRGWEAFRMILDYLGVVGQSYSLTDPRCAWYILMNWPGNSRGGWRLETSHLSTRPSPSSWRTRLTLQIQTASTSSNSSWVSPLQCLTSAPHAHDVEIWSA